MKKIALLALAALPMLASAQSLIVTLQNGETVKYPVNQITRLSFEDEIVPVEDQLPLAAFTDAVLRAEVAKADANEDGQLSTSELAGIKSLNLANSNVSSLEGIKYLTELTDLNLASCMRLTALDLSDCCDKLQFLQVGFCDNLVSLKLGSKPALTELYAMYNGLESIDLDGAVALETLTVAGTKLTSVAVRDNKSLRSFKAGSEILESVDLTGCDNLTDIALSDMVLLSNFDVAKFPLLESFALTESKISSFSTVSNRQLKSLTLNNNERLSSVDVSKSLKLNTLSCLSCYDLESVVMTEGQVINNLYGVSDWMISRVEREYPEDVAAELEDETFRQVMIAAADTDGDGKISAQEAKALTVLDASGKNLTSVDFFYFGNLTELNLSDNALTSVDLSALTKLETLNLNGNKLTSLAVERLSELKYLYAANNEIASIDRLGSSALIEIDLSHNKLTAVQIYFKSKLTKINISYNEIATAEIRNNNSLADLDVSHNKITEITMWSLTGLVNVKFNDNPFIQLNEANNWTKLETIDCSNTDIPTLNLSQTEVLTKCVATGCANLTTIYAGNNTGADIVKDAGTTVVYGAPEE